MGGGPGRTRSIERLQWLATSVVTWFSQYIPMLPNKVTTEAERERPIYSRRRVRCIRNIYDADLHLFRGVRSMSAAQKKYIGKITSDTMLSCSRLPAIMGMSQYETPSDVLRSVTSAIEAGDNYKRDDTVPSEAAHWGNQTEGMILAEGCRRLGLVDPELEVNRARDPRHDPIAGLARRSRRRGRGHVHDGSRRGIYVIGQDKITLEGMGVLEAKNTSHFPEDEPAATRGRCNARA